MWGCAMWGRPSVEPLRLSLALVWRHWGAGFSGGNRIGEIMGQRPQALVGCGPAQCRRGPSRLAWCSGVALAKANSVTGYRVRASLGRVLGQSRSLALLWARPRGRDCPRARASRGGALAGHYRAFRWVQLKKAPLLPAAQDRS